MTAAKNRRRLAAPVFQRHRRHGQPDVVGEQGDELVHVAGFEGLGELGDDRLLGRRARRRGRLSRGRGRQAALQGRAGAVERAGHRPDAGVEDSGHLAGAEPEDVVQDEDGALAGRQELQRGDERQRDGLGGRKPRPGPGRAVGEPLEEDVRAGLEPDQLVQHPVL